VRDCLLQGAAKSNAPIFYLRQSRGASHKCFEAFSSGQSCLPVIERPETFGFEFKGTRDVEAVQRADPKLRSIATREVRAEIEGVVRYRNKYPASGALMIFNSRMHSLRFRKRNLSAKNVLAQSMRPLSIVEGSKPKTRSGHDSTARIRGMLIGQV
jgi:hypothetical protein